MSRTRVAVVFGGRSTEHAISCISAGGVLAALDPERYDVIAVGITPQGRWVLGPADPTLLALSGRELPTVKDGLAIALPGDPTVGGLLPLEDGPAMLGRIDVAFPVLHGPYGEDGTIQGLLEMASVPYVGSGVLASAAAMDKVVAKKLLAAAGIMVAPSIVVRLLAWRSDAQRVVEAAREIGLPVFVKPARGGSSIGISKVTDWTQLAAAVETALAADPKVLIEAAIVGREVELGVLDSAEGPRVSVPAEIRVSGEHEFYDFEAKYLEGATELDCPADLPDPVTAELTALAARAFLALDCEGLARVDFFVPESGPPVLNEINTMPGFTPTSMFPRMWAASGMDYAELVDHLVQDALRRGTGLR